MNRIKTRRLGSLLLLASSILSIVSCNPKPSTSSPTTDASTVSSKDSSNDQEKKVDKSNLKYVESLDAYKKEDWTASWIWTKKSIANSYVAFRKNFTLDEKPSKALANISAESKYYLWANGTLAVYDGSSKRGATIYDSYYEQIDLAQYLTKGENTLVFLVSYNGRSGNSSVDSGQAGLLFEMNVGNQTIKSDCSFKALRLKAYRNKSLLGADWPNYAQSSMLAEWDCYYDNRESVGNFIDPSFDDSSWEDASIVGKVGYEPFNDTYLSETPKMEFDEDITWLESDWIGKKITEKKTITVDLPENMQFSPYFELNSDSAGLRFTYYTNTLTSQEIDSFKDDYVASEGSQSYESYPWRSGSQLIIEAPAGMTFTKIGYRRSGYDSKISGSFVSSDDKLNSLWKKAANTLKICMRDTYMDCPERERSPYIGDSANQIRETFYALDSNSYLMTKKTLLASVGWTKTDSEIPLRSPSATLNECPAQTLNYIVSAYDYLMYTGDVETYSLFYPVALDYLKLWTMDDDGTIVYRSGSFPWTDWGEGADATLLQNCWYYYALDSMKKASTIIGKNDDSFYDARLSSIKDGISKFKKADGYRSGDSLDDRANAMMVVSGLADESDYSLIYGVLQKVMLASPYMEGYVSEALCLMGHEDYAIDRMLTRYSSMIEDKESTLWELWSKSDGTINHGWSGGCLTVLSKYIGGISPTSKGYDSYSITLSESLDELSTGCDTPKGSISYSLSKEDTIRSLSLKTIQGQGTLYIPSSFGTPSVSGGNYEKLDSIDGYSVIKLTGGDYSITIQ